MRAALLFVPILTLLGDCASRRLRVMTFNIWQTGMRVSNGLQKVAKHIAFVDPDIVALQEAKLGDSAPALLSLLGHPWTVLTDEESRLDVAILTKHTVMRSTVTKTSHAIGGRIDLGFGDAVSMWNVHLDHKAYGPHAANNKMVASVDQILAGEKLNNRAGRVQNIMEIFDDPQMKHWLNKSDNVPLILAGDFNTPSHLDWTEETIGRHGNWVVQWPVTKIVEAMGFIDSFRVVHPNVSEVPGYTWSTVYKFLPEWDFKIPEPQDRIDFIFYKGREINMMNDLAPELSRRKRAAWGAFKSIEDVVKRTKNTLLRAHIFDLTVLLALCYASETWSLRKQDERSLSVIERAVERTMIGNMIAVDSFIYAGPEAIKPIPYHRENDYPSDHFAVVTEFEMEESEKQ
ncbi:unnamed protein product [Angiostrongylus costaricensis]|uniref:Endo/exonuclease/phosphatase domain-containing protein n=1 Tax=Angiostrongylus costaricensis TaxID=334426 RepID=A0A158PEP1_ANGCS|nr:unnamed protein product [Angiostrongylus costaricensis]